MILLKKLYVCITVLWGLARCLLPVFIHLNKDNITFLIISKDTKNYEGFGIKKRDVAYFSMLEKSQI